MIATVNTNRQRALTADLDQLARRLVAKLFASSKPDLTLVDEYEREAMRIARRYAVSPAFLPAVRRFVEQLGDDLLGAADEDDENAAIERCLTAVSVLADEGVQHV